MLNMLPEVLRKDNIIKMYDFLQAEFDKFDKEIEDYKYYNILSKVSNDSLDRYGQQYVVYRNGLDDENYKRKIMIEVDKRNFVPTLDNFISIVKNITGYDVIVVEGWNLPVPKKALLDVELTIPQGFDPNLLFDLDRIYSAGVKLNINTLREAYMPKEIIGPHNKVGHRGINRRWIGYSQGGSNR